MAKETDKILGITGYNQVQEACQDMFIVLGLIELL